MITVTLWTIGAVATIAGLFKLKRLVNIIKQSKEVYEVYQSAKQAESDKGVEISAAEWRNIADEAMDVLKLVISWGLIWYSAKSKD